MNLAFIRKKMMQNFLQNGWSGMATGTKHIIIIPCSFQKYFDHVTFEDAGVARLQQSSVL